MTLAYPLSNITFFFFEPFPKLELIQSPGIVFVKILNRIIFFSGQQDTDCPNYGLCCFDGCANTCQKHVYNPRVSSDHGDTCPVVESKTEEECSGAVATCWSRGVPDVDCPDFGLCCFDGCVNTCKIHDETDEEDYEAYDETLSDAIDEDDDEDDEDYDDSLDDELDDELDDYDSDDLDDLDAYGAPAAPVVSLDTIDSYGSPLADTLDIDTYGSPAADPITGSNIFI